MLIPQTIKTISQQVQVAFGSRLFVGLRCFLVLLVTGVLSACGEINDPSTKPMTVLTPEQKARFMQSVNAVGEVTRWRPVNPEMPNQLQLVADDKVVILKQLDERCQFKVERPNEPTPTPTPQPAAQPLPTNVQKAKIVSKKKGEVDCPVNFNWDLALSKTLDKDSGPIARKHEESLQFVPTSVDVKNALNVERYEHSLQFAWTKKGEIARINGDGQGTLTLNFGGGKQTVVFSMRATGVESAGSTQYGISYFFVYSDGMQVELKMDARKDGATYTLNSEAINAVEFASILSKFGVRERMF